MTHGLLDGPFDAKDSAGLKELSSLVHDETCSMDEMVHDPLARTLLLPVRRQFHGGEEVVVSKGLVATTYEKFWMRSEVLIRHVRSWNKEDDQGIGDYSFNEWEWAAGSLEIVFCEALKLRVLVDKLEITMTDLGFSGRARIERYVGGAESTSSKVY